MKRICVTGSSGVLGSEIIRQLKKLLYNVIGIDLVASETTDLIIDIRNPYQVREITSQVNVIIHTAALHGRHTDLAYPRDEFIASNINGCNNLLSASILNCVHKFIYVSSTSIYGHAMESQNCAVWVDEGLPPVPRDIYDITKLTAEFLCRDYFICEGMETVALRISRFLPESNNIKAIHRLYRGIDVRDGAKAVILTLEKSFKSFEIFNISSDSPFQREDIYELFRRPKEVIEKYYPNIVNEFAKRDWIFPDKIDRVYSIEKAKKELNYRPAHNFESLLNAILD